MSTPSVPLALDRGVAAIYDITTAAPGPEGQLPFTPDDLRDKPSGDLFGWSLDVGMGWAPDAVRQPQALLLSTLGGMREPDGTPLALGYHTGHWEVGLLMREAALTCRATGWTPFAGFCTDPCDGRSQGTPGMFDSLPYRNDAATVLGRLIRSLPTRSAVLGVATCDKGLPAMLMAIAGAGDLPVAIVPGGVTLPSDRGEDAGTIQTIGARFSHGLISLEEAAALGCRACASPGGGCQFLGTAASAQVVAEAIGLAPVHSALAPSGQPIWLDGAARAVHGLQAQRALGWSARTLVTEASIRNAMVAHAAFGGSTNLLLHVPAIAHAAGIRRPSIEDWMAVNRAVPRLVDALPAGPHPTVRVHLAGGVPEVLLHLRALGLLDTSVPTASGLTLDAVLDWWAQSERRVRCRTILRDRDGVDPDRVIMPPSSAAAAGLSSTVCFMRGTLAPEGAIVKSTAIARDLLGDDGVFRHTGPARVFTSEKAAIAAIKGHDPETALKPGEVVVVAGIGPMGTGMEEVYQVTSALKHLPAFKGTPLITDARFSGVSTGPCVGHVGPEALAGGPLGRLRDGDLVRVLIDTRALTGTVDLVRLDAASGELLPDADTLAARQPHPDLAPHPQLPAATRLWAALQAASGGTWGGCVYDVDAITMKLNS
ncbi:dehydratase [Luteitalea sp. TBR-22]|uniref:YjhG/YagF family D-xylonate dehydratase n=1 Tax=Luteitalea sp. TBR-22 TaxID=2802971 RepID=UPI001AFB097C|nr:YjhG/YagF family D-xylonate dehydratase [Luteitalea sp. TBR-22]BCS32961.1 dehydratase [Luteitalea sp. TBR-22]